MPKNKVIQGALQSTLSCYEFLRSKTRSFQRLGVLTETFVFFPTVMPPGFCSHFNSKPLTGTDRGICTNLTVRIPTLETCLI